MILFRCPGCGAAHRAEPQYAGGTIPCQSCGEQVPIPRKTDPDCVLVYKAGESEDGLPIAREDVLLKLVSGELAGTDLVWDNSTWRPLSQAFGGVHEGEGLQLKKAPEPGDDEGELAESLDDLSPIQKLDMDDLASAGKKRGGSRRSKANREALAKQGGSGPVAGGGGTGSTGKRTRKKSDRSRRGKVYYVAQAAMGILAIVLGFRYGFGPLVSRYRHKPSYVAVFNHEDIGYSATFGWRRQTLPVSTRGTVIFEAYVGIPEHQTLRLSPSSPGQGTPFNVSVPLRPGAITLVNLKQLGQYGIYDMDSAREMKVESPELNKLAAEIAANKAPASAIKVSRQIRDLVGGVFLGVTNDLILSSSKYDVDELVLSRLHKPGGRRGGEPPPAPVRSGKTKPVVTFPANATVSFANGSAQHQPLEDGPVQRSIVLPLSTVQVSPARVLNVASPRLIITGNDKEVQLRLSVPNAAVTVGSGDYKGQWIYQASCLLEGATRGNWSWSWEFRGASSAGGPRRMLELKVDTEGRESEKVTTT